MKTLDSKPKGSIEKHYRVNELAGVLGISRHSVINDFANEPGVVHRQKGLGKRKYDMLLIPESVVHRVLARQHQQVKPPQKEIRTVRLKDLKHGS